MDGGIQRHLHYLWEHIQLLVARPFETPSDNWVRLLTSGSIKPPWLENVENHGIFVLLFYYITMILDRIM